MTTHILMIFLAAVLTENIALTYLLGMCPFVALARSLKVATGMGFAVIFVVTLTALINWPIYHLILVPLNSELIYYIVFIIVIAASVQLVEMIMEKFFPALQAAFGIFLPLITVNCTVLAVSLFMVLREYSYLETIIFAIGAAVGWVLAIVLVAAIYEKLDLVGDIPKGLQGPGIIMVIAGIIALAFLGFAGMVRV
ncbi:NADH:ubiquinone reductase (Na(+)-transporting) subunit E [candidate division KSB3 bacterium]|uniref:NADH:ubiquinone reductase (Na(+)-transporting) subunit E n=1 Tax=candidate division KSB3 bacterium TaxID=2044937 RepID=A0A9D5JT05_9BACT|nr:NADH:ubiquinone reductase (Na(+)-transporting) subunit E [candidate division KSB3 bacterium]MBD3323560.1 NADH:ubiquinone reductase (Na(+)-transporting) subunit E [candidate division KSB3 bacterium]